MDFVLPSSVKAELEALSASPKSSETIRNFCILLEKWNQKISLTGSKSSNDIALDHVLDSLIAAKHLPKTEAFIDIGSGAGFPGLILAIIWPEREAHLVEPKEKSATFLKEAVKSLGLTNVTIHVRTIEDLQGDEIVPIYQESFCISRAFSPIKKFIGYCHYLIREETPLYLMTGEESDVLDPQVLEKHQIYISKSINYDTSKPKKLLVELKHR